MPADTAVVPDVTAIHLDEEEPGAPPVPLREVRIAASFVGGTSLAIYEFGVASELLEVVRGEGVYGFIKWLTWSHAYVDVLAGTSAGGINGITLAAALANRTSMKAVEDFWLDVTSIDKMFLPLATSQQSIFDGESYMVENATKVFGALLGPSGAPARRGLESGWMDDVDAYAETDVYVTGTFFQGAGALSLDARNEASGEVNHAGLFHFRHRPWQGCSHLVPALAEPKRPGAGDKSHFDGPARMAALVTRLTRVARTTSSLPVLFVPSPVKASEMNGIIALPGARGDEELERAMVDGGYLDNRPIDVLMRAVYSRPATREVERLVLFVEPVPPALESSFDGAPSPLQNLGFYAMVPHSENRQDTFEAMASHNALVHALEKSRPAARRLAAGSLAAENIDVYAGCLKQDVRSWLEAMWKKSALDRARATAESTGAIPRDSVVPQVLRATEVAQQFARRTARREAVGLASWTAKHDILRAIRLIDRAIDEVYRLLYADDRHAPAFPWREWHEARSVLDRLYHLRRVGAAAREFLEVALLQLEPDFASDVPLGQRLDQVQQRFERWLRAPKDPLLADFGEQMKTEWEQARAAPDGDARARASRARESAARMNRRRLREFVDDLQNGHGGGEGGTLVEVLLEEMTRAIAEGVHGLRPFIEAQDPSRHFQSGVELRAFLENLDVLLYPRERDAGMWSPDGCTMEKVAFTHLTPENARLGFSDLDPDDKLAGDALSNVGGFLRKTWRVNDIMWGKVDAAAVLVDLLLDERRLEALMRLRGRETVKTLLEQTLFKRTAESPEGDKVGRLLAQLRPDTSLDAMVDKREALREMLILRQQLDILMVEMDKLERAAGEEGLREEKRAPSVLSGRPAGCDRPYAVDLPTWLSVEPLVVRAPLSLNRRTQLAAIPLFTKVRWLGKGLLHVGRLLGNDPMIPGWARFVATLVSLVGIVAYGMAGLLAGSAIAAIPCLAALLPVSALSTPRIVAAVVLLLSGAVMVGFMSYFRELDDDLRNQGWRGMLALELSFSSQKAGAMTAGLKPEAKRALLDSLDIDDWFVATYGLFVGLFTSMAWSGPPCLWLLGAVFLACLCDALENQGLRRVLRGDRSAVALSSTFATVKWILILGVLLADLIRTGCVLIPLLPDPLKQFFTLPWSW
jgi:patatin-related protein